ncbi:metallophosphoesterase family protein [Methylomagnum sp.]
MKFLHCADIHLDSPLLGLDRYDGAPVDELRGATRRAFRDLVDLAIRETVDFVVIAGDLFDGDWPDFNSGLFFVREMARLREAGIRVALAKGNHDAESRITKSLPLPDNVFVFNHKKPETRVWEDLGVALHGQSFGHREASDDLAAAYPPGPFDLFNIGVLHTSLDGRAGHASYAPTRTDVLRGRGYDYWALGHAHAREIVSTGPHIVFPGNLQGRNVREAGPKGCELVSVESGEISTEFRPLDNLRWAHLRVDTDGLADSEMLLSAVRAGLVELTHEAGDRLLAVRLSVAGRGKLGERLAGGFDAVEAELRAVGLDFSPAVWLEKIRFDLRPALDRASAARRPDAIGEMLRLVDRLTASDEELAELGRQVFADLTKLPSDTGRGPDGLQLDDPATLSRLLAEAETLLLSRLHGDAAP